jgi:flagellar protein FliS
MMNAYVNQYRNNQILNAPPEQILIMLYDGAIRFCRQAMLAMDSGDKKVRAEKISRTMAIICEFANSLDHQVGGEIATDLEALYAYMVRELTTANLKNNRSSLETVEALLVDLRETWGQAIEVNRQETQPAVSANPAERHVAASF